MSTGLVAGWTKKLGGKKGEAKLYRSEEKKIPERLCLSHKRSAKKKSEPETLPKKTIECEKENSEGGKERPLDKGTK